MWRLIELIVRSGLVIACRFASCPTRRSPVFVNATTDGVVREPSALGMTTGAVPSITATTELVVPRSIPTVLAIKTHTSFYLDVPTALDQLCRAIAFGRGSRKRRISGGKPCRLRQVGFGIPLHHTRWAAGVVSLFGTNIRGPAVAGPPSNGPYLPQLFVASGLVYRSKTSASRLLDLSQIWSVDSLLRLLVVFGRLALLLRLLLG